MAPGEEVALLDSTTSRELRAYSQGTEIGDGEGLGARVIFCKRLSCSWVTHGCCVPAEPSTAAPLKPQSLQSAKHSVCPTPDTCHQCAAGYCAAGDPQPAQKKSPLVLGVCSSSRSPLVPGLCHHKVSFGQTQVHINLNCPGRYV